MGRTLGLGSTPETAGELHDRLALLGPGAVGRVLTQLHEDARRVEPDEGGYAPFEYVWDQGAADAGSGRITCRIHFELDGGRRLADAFVYDWRLWRAMELAQAAGRAGFAQAAVWWSAPGSEGRFTPNQAEPDASDWVAYVVARAPG